MKDQQKSIFNRRQLLSALRHSFLKLAPQVQIRNPVMFVTYLAAIFMIVFVCSDLFHYTFSWFNFQIALCLLLTVVFGNLAEALAEGRAKAHAESLHHTQKYALAHKWNAGYETSVSVESLRKGDIIVCKAGDIIPADGEVIEGIATVDESAITGESAPVIRESGGDRSAVTEGTMILSDQIIIKVFAEPGKSFLDRTTQLIEGIKRERTPQEISLYFVLSAITIFFLFAVVSLKFFVDYSVRAVYDDFSNTFTLPMLTTLFVCLIPTTVSALLGAVEIAAMDRLIRKNVIAKNGRSVEAAAAIDLLILDKTGTITIGNRMATQFVAIDEMGKENLVESVLLASFFDETSEGRSIVILSKNQFMLAPVGVDPKKSKFIPFSVKTRMSGIDISDDKGEIVRCIRKGSVDAIRRHVENLGGVYPKGLDEKIYLIAKSGGTPLLVSENDKILGVVHLKDIIKGGIKNRFNLLRKMGIRTLMVTGDNPLTAAAIAADSGVDDYIAEASPEVKLEKIRKEQSEGRLVAMVGDGTDDAPALAQADIGIAMNAGTQACREAANIVDLDSDPTKLIEIIEIGKQILITRGVLMTFSVISSVAKCSVILPVILSTVYVDVKALNIMGLHSSYSALLSAVIYNALVILAFIPLALRGIRSVSKYSNALLLRYGMVYGLGGILAPFIFIKLIDMVISYE